MTDIKFQKADIADIIEQRTKILRPGQWPTPERYPQDNLTTTNHFSATESGQIVAIGTLILNAPLGELIPTSDRVVSVQLRGMGVDDSYRRQGVGAGLLELISNHLEATSQETLLWFNAREVAIPFYESSGFIAVGEFFPVPKIGQHKVMWKLLGDPL